MAGTALPPLEAVGLVRQLCILILSDSVKNDGGRVFVHCQAGISRSATICLAYLMRTNRVKLDEAFEFVKQRRSIISPNFSFMGQLLQFESQVLAPNCSAEAGSPAMSVLDRGASTTTVFNFPVSIPVHTSSSALSYLQSPITTSPSCWEAGENAVRTQTYCVRSAITVGTVSSVTCVLWGTTHASQNTVTKRSSPDARELGVTDSPAVFSSQYLDAYAKSKGRCVFLSCSPLSSVCPKPAAHLVVCSPVFPFLDTLSNTDAVPSYDNPIYLFLH